HLVQRKIIELPDHAPPITEQTSVHNKFVSFKFTADASGRMVKLEHRYRTLAERVPAEAISEYLAALSAIEGSLGYKLKPRRDSEDSQSPLAAFLALLAVPTIVLLFVGARKIRGRIRKRRLNERHRHAPGAAPHTALVVRAKESIESAVKKVKCSNCGRASRVASPPSEAVFQGKPLLVVRCTCPVCTTIDSVYLQVDTELSAGRLRKKRRAWLAAILAMI